MHDYGKLIGLFPAGGKATRLGSIPCSKEIIPVKGPDGNSIPVGQFLTDAYIKAGVDEILIISREEKNDLRCYFSDTTSSTSVRHLPLKRPWGTPFTLDDAWIYTQGHLIVLGFPDIIFHPTDVFLQLRKRLTASRSDVVLGLFPTNAPSKADMVNLNSNGHVISLDIKPDITDLKLTWVTAIWTPAFTKFMHQFLQREELLYQHNPDKPEPFVGTVINAAISNGLIVEGLIIDQGTFLDIGTPESLQFAQAHWALGEKTS